MQSNVQDASWLLARGGESPCVDMATILLPDNPLWRIGGLSLMGGVVMNRFGRLAQKLWTEMAPASLAEIPDPEVFFTALGEEAEGTSITLSRELAGPDVPGETFMGKVGRLNNARMRAEEIVRAEMLYPPSSMTPEAEDPEDDDPTWVDPWQVLWEAMEADRQEDDRQEDEMRRARETDEFF